MAVGYTANRIARSRLAQRLAPPRRLLRGLASNAQARVFLVLGCVAQCCHRDHERITVAPIRGGHAMGATAVLFARLRVANTAVDLRPALSFPPIVYDCPAPQVNPYYPNLTLWPPPFCTSK